MGTIIGSIITGAIIGALARVFMPGRQNISIIWTIILGAIGAFVGTWVAGFFGAPVLLVLTGSVGPSQCSLRYSPSRSI